MDPKLHEDLFKLIIDSVKDYAIFLLDVDGRVSTWNEGARRLKGYEAHEIIGQHFSKFYPIEDIQNKKPEYELKHAIKDGRFEDEGWRLKKDGSRFWANVIISPVYGPDHNLIGFSKVTRDLTERKRAEEAVRELNTDLEKRVAKRTAELEDARRRAQNEMQFLAEAGQILFSTLNYSEALHNLANLSVSKLCDWCSIDILDPVTSEQKTVAVAHADPKKVDWVKKLSEKYPPNRRTKAGASEVIRSGKSELYTSIPDTLLKTAATNEEHYNLISELGMRSAMVVPLSARGRTIGAISFVSAESGRQFNSEDLHFAEELARRAGLAIENAQFYMAAAQSEEQFRALADSISQLAWIAHGDGYIYWFNKRWFEYTGTTLVTQEGWAWKSVHHPAEFPRVIASWNSHIEAGEAFEMEYPLRSADGKYRWFLTRCVPIKNSDGKVVRWFGTSTDIDEQKEIQLNLEKAVRIRDDFMSIASHELKTPITSLRLQLQLAKRGIRAELKDSASGNRLAAAVDTSLKQVDRLIILVEDLLDVSRIQAGKLEFTFSEAFYLKELVELVATRFTEDLEINKSKIMIDIDSKLSVWWDRSRMDQVLSNLISNSIKYAPMTPIEIVAKKVDSQIVLSIQDHGPGIEPERQARIFERFERANASRSISGLGLGLYIVDQIVRGHHGSIRLESSEQTGAKFIMTLPEKPRAVNPMLNEDKHGL